MATLAITQEGTQQASRNGMVPIQAGSPNWNNLNNVNQNITYQGKTYNLADPAEMSAYKSSIANVPSPTGTNSSTATPGTTPLPMPLNTSSGSKDPYTIFNQQVGSILTQIQNSQSKGSAVLGGAKDALATESVTSAPYDPTMTPSGNINNMTGTEAAFKPAMTSINTQLENANTSLGLLANNIKDLAQIYAPEVISPGQSLVAKDGTVIKQGHSYTYVPINPNTGLPDGFDSTSGTYASQDNKDSQSSVVSHGPSSGIVAGIELGASADGRIQPYATKQGYADDINHIYNDIKRRIPMPSAEAFDEYIKNNAIGKSPVTGNMIMLSAGQYGIDPYLLAAVFNDESSFGTDGAAVKTMNPGNIGNTDNGSTRTFGTWKQGVDATAKELQRRMVTAKSLQQTQTSKTTDQRGNTISPAYQARVSQLNPVIQNYVLAGPGGVAFIDGDTADNAGLKQSVAFSAPKVGLPVLDGGAKSQLNSLNTLAQQQETMRQLVNDNLSNGDYGGSTVGHILNTLTAGANKISQNKPALATLNAYINSVTTAAENIKSLAGGQGSGVRITGFEIGDIKSNLPNENDSWQTAQAKIKAMDLKLSQALHSLFPDYPAGDINTPNIVHPASQAAYSGGAGGGAKSGVTPSGITYKVI